MYESVLRDGINKTVRHKNFPSHKHYKDEMYVCFGGSATDIVDEKNKAVMPGDVYVHKKGIIHRQTDIEDFYCVVFQFDMEELKKRAEETSLSESVNFEILFVSKGDLFLDANTLRYAEAISDIIKNETDEYVRDEMFLSLLNIILRKCKKRGLCKSSPIHADIEEIVRYVEHNYDKNITLETLSRKSNYSTRHFTRLFRETVGMSPMEYLNEVRIKNACHLLTVSNMSVTEIGRLCGFEDNNLFSRRFKELKNLSPTSYRKLNTIK